MLILASTSPYRRQLLQRLGLPFEVVAPGVDESAYAGLEALRLTETLAEAKTKAVAARFPDAVVIGSDQVAALDRTILGKPGTAAQAEAQLAALAGRTHTLYTSVAIVSGATILRHTDVTRLTMRALDSEAIARYVAHDQPLDCAGAYKLEQQGIALFERIESADQSAIQGLPLLAVVKMLDQLGLRVP